MKLFSVLYKTTVVMASGYKDYKSLSWVYLEMR
jgi:hypothetical protein